MITDVPEGLADEIYDVLTHFYDYAYLSRHPILSRLRPMLGGGTTGAVKELRRVMMEAIEALRPPVGTSPTDRAWRPYRVLHLRYILGQELEELQEALHIGARQVQREQRRAIEALAAALMDKLPADDLPDGQEQGNALWTEISIASEERRLFDAATELEGVLQAVSVLAEKHGVTLRLERDSGRMLVAGSASLFRQFVLGTLSYLIRSSLTEALVVHMMRRAESLICALTATAPLQERAPELPATVLALAQAQGATCLQEELAEGWRLLLTWPAASEQPYKIVLVEDNADVIALFSRYLAKEGYQLIGVQESATALERIAEIHPNAVVLDLMMKNPDGWELLQRIKADPVLCQIPVIVCSVLDERELAMSLGAAAYLRKPIRSAALLECLSAVCH
ncbi:MAG: response regulator [Chloroflexi bacterium]|nr:response regulator [Chloroflexota bacterium]